jgi:hypothetical protein
VRDALQFTGEKFEFMTRMLGQMLGTELYDAYLDGRAAKRFLRVLFLRKLAAPGAARQAYFGVVRRIRKPRRRPLAA